MLLMLNSIERRTETGTFSVLPRVFRFLALVAVVFGVGNIFCAGFKLS